MILFFAIPVLVFSFAILTNLVREYRSYHFDLKPNCLLTRNPVVFLTGPRSLFYFRKYWNGYPEVLAEHGYQVFTVHLPWRGPARIKKFTEFLKTQAELGKKFHFICDKPTGEEFKELFEQSLAVASYTLLQDTPGKIVGPITSSYFLSAAYKLHAFAARPSKVPPASDVGLQFPTASSWLLTQMQEKAEQDFLQ